MDPLLKFSSSEEVAFKTCRLAHHFAYDLGYRPIVTNRKLSVGIGAHLGCEAYYQDKTRDEIEAILDNWAEERWAELVAGGKAEDQVVRIEFVSDRDLVKAMVFGYIDWVAETGVDDDYETVEVEKAHYISFPDCEAVLPVKLDLVQRNLTTGKLRIVDFKTAQNFTTDTTKYQLSEQNGNYSLAIMSVYGERPTELAYRELRKIVPSTRSKPPYFREIRVRLTPEEMLHRAAEYVAVANERFSEDRAIFANPSACCGSWKNDWQQPCLKVHQGMTPLEALESSPRYGPADSYARYSEEENPDE